MLEPVHSTVLEPVHSTVLEPVHCDDQSFIEGHIVEWEGGMGAFRSFTPVRIFFQESDQEGAIAK